MARYLVAQRIKTGEGTYFPGQVVEFDETGREAAILLSRRMITPVDSGYTGRDPSLALPRRAETPIEPVDPDALVGDESEDLKDLMGMDKDELQALADNADLDTSNASSKRELALLILAAAREADVTAKSEDEQPGANVDPADVKNIKGEDKLVDEEGNPISSASDLKDTTPDPPTGRAGQNDGGVNPNDDAQTLAEAKASATVEQDFADAPDDATPEAKAKARKAK
jgi:hypothetical protein